MGWAVSTNIGDWSDYLNGISKQDYFKELIGFLNQRGKQNIPIYPPKTKWFRAFELTHFSDVKVIILGQDPYHNEGQAQGLSFSVPDGMKLPPSLQNIYKELELDLGIPINSSGDLSRWAKQGVLLLNSVLTVEKNTPGAHAGRGWERFTDTVIDLLNENKKNLVFMLWGAYAQKKAEFIDQQKHLVLRATHPSPFSAHKGFFGCKHFSKANQFLTQTHQKEIQW